MDDLIAGPQVQPAGDSTIPCGRWDGADTSSLARALAYPVRLCTEADWTLPDEELSALSGQDTIALALSTASAYRIPPGPPMVSEIAARTTVSADLRERIQTALNEAISNALVHGNLELHRILRDSFLDLDRLHQHVEDLLGRHALANRYIGIFAHWTTREIVVRVRDQGAGYSCDAEADMSNVDKRSGRGLAIIRTVADSVSVSDGGRCISMGFAP